MLSELSRDEKTIFVVAITVIVLCGLSIFSIDNITKSNYKRASLAQLQTVLWKFSSSKRKEVMMEIDNLSWWKLLLAGLMLSMTFVTMCLKRLGGAATLLGAGCIFTAWTIFILVFWRISVAPKYSLQAADELETKQSSTSTTTARVGINDERTWAERKRSSTDDKRLPLTIITGFLGSGKTTLVKKLLSNSIGMKILVIENEIGSEGIDHELLMQQVSKEDIILLNNGCICCTVRQDVLKLFQTMFKDASFSRLDWIVIETTGLADPAPLIQTLYMDEDCKTYLRMDSVLTVVDCKHLPMHLSSYYKKEAGAHEGAAIPEAVQQLVYADRILLNKTDLVTSDELQEVTIAVQQINPTAKLLSCVYSDIPVEEILNIKAFDPLTCKALIDTTSNDAWQSISPSVSSRTFLPVGEDGKSIISKKRISSNVQTERGSRVNISSGTRLSSNSINTVSLVSTRAVDFDKFNGWIAYIMKTEGPKIYRMKGILNMAGFEEQFVVHGIHMIFDGERSAKWSDSAVRNSKLVFIGLGINKEDLEFGFNACLVK